MGLLSNIRSALQPRRDEAPTCSHVDQIRDVAPPLSRADSAPPRRQGTGRGKTTYVSDAWGPSMLARW
jgi:hypothetical protein